MGDSEQEQAVFDRPGRSTTSSTGPVASGTLVYEELLNRDPRWALSEGSRHFDTEP
jgi:hypothetical protein